MEAWTYLSMGVPFLNSIDFFAWLLADEVDALYLLLDGALDVCVEGAGKVENTLHSRSQTSHLLRD